MNVKRSLIAAFGLCVLAFVTWSARSGFGTQPADWAHVVSRLQYIEDDYVEAIEANDARELEEQAMLAKDSANDALAGRSERTLVTRLVDLERDIRARRAPLEVHEICGALIADIVREQRLRQAPVSPPDLARGRELYAASCASCHGDHAGVKTQAAEAMRPSPPSFFAADTVNGLTPWKAFGFMSYGIARTPMPSFAALAEKDRWALAFFLFTLREPPCRSPTSLISLQELATLSDNELVARFGEPSLPCLRQGLGMPVRTAQTPDDR